MPVEQRGQAIAFEIGSTGNGRNPIFNGRRQPSSGDDAIRMRALARALVGLKPDIVLTQATETTAAVQRETWTIPIVFANVADPVASGLVPRLNQPGGNVTGFAAGEPAMAGKWLELLSEIAPGLKRVAIMFNPGTAALSIFMPSLETAARSLKVEAIAAPPHRRSIRTFRPSVQPKPAIA